MCTLHISLHISLQIAKIFLPKKKYIYIFIFHKTALALTRPEVRPVLAETAPQFLFKL